MTRLKSTEGNRVIALNGADWTELIANLATQLERVGEPLFERGTHVGLEATEHEPSAAGLEQLAWLLEMYDVKLDWWKHVDEKATRVPASVKNSFALANSSEVKAGHLASDIHVSTRSSRQDGKLWREAALVSRTLRSGQYVRYAGTVVVMGDVSPGAVIVADGNIIVWGRLRGVAHAGAGGDETAVVGALELAPSQLRIGGLVARATDVYQGPTMCAELARALDGQILIEPWNDEKL